MVTMQQIDVEREVANFFLEKSRDTKGLPQSQRLFRARYEVQLKVVEDLLRQYHKERYMNDARKEELKRLDDTSRSKAVEKGENTFTLRAQDMSSPMVVIEWIRLNIETAPEEKLRQAFDIALAMRDHPARKRAD